MQPLNKTLNSPLKEYDEKFKPKTQDKALKDPTGYRKLIGELLYLTLSRLDLMFDVQSISHFMHERKTSHFLATKRIVKYLKGNSGLGCSFLPKGICTPLPMMTQIGQHAT